MQKTEISKLFLIEEYINKKKSIADIMKISGRSNTYIKKKLKEYNINIRTISEANKGKIKNTKYSKNETYFNIPTIENCYWAGFIAADGCIKDKNGKKISNPLLEITLKTSDINHLEKFIKTVNYNGKIYNRKQKYKNHFTYSSQLIICNALKWTQYLKKHWNITPRKSLTIKPPNISNFKQQLAYIIGLIDGDGSINILKNNSYIQFNLIGTKKLLEWVSKIIYKIENQQKYKTMNCHKKSNSNIFTINNSHNRAYNMLKTLKNFIIQNNIPCLNRKWDKIHGC